MKTYQVELYFPSIWDPPNDKWEETSVLEEIEADSEEDARRIVEEKIYTGEWCGMLELNEENLSSIGEGYGQNHRKICPRVGDIKLVG